MILHIDDSMTVSDVQDKFSRCFPNLKIEFYAKQHHFKEGSSDVQRLDSSIALSIIRKNHTPENLAIISSDRAGDIERKFMKVFGLNIQVFRKENGSWKQTGNSDTCTLKELSDLSTHSS